MTMKITGAEVRDARIAAGYTQAAMAELLGHTLRNYQRKETGKDYGDGVMVSTLLPGELRYMQTLAMGSVPALEKVVKASRKMLEHFESKAREADCHPRTAKIIENLELALSELDHSKQTR